MSNRAITWAYQQPLKAGPKFVLVTLADMADQEHSCFPGIPELARLTGFGDTAVSTHIKALIDGRYIAKERRARKDGARTSNRYYLNVDGSLTEENLTPESGDSSQEPNPGIRGALTPESEAPNPGIRGAILEPPVNPKTEPPVINGDRDTELAPIATDDLPLEETNPDFGYFWAIWPRKDGKKAALAAWAKAIKRAPSAVIVAAAHVYANSPWRPERQFVPHAATWLNGDRWDDPPPGPPEQRTAPPLPAHRPAVQAGLDLVAQFAQEEAHHEPHRDSAALDRGSDARRHPA